ncbi:MAG: D-2-hydroxyacid dehydrogenase [Raoultibacter sp.]
MIIKVLEAYVNNPGDLSWEPLSAWGEVTLYDRTAREDLFARIADVEIAITSKIVWDKEAFEAAPCLKMIALTSTGFNVVDLDEANRRGIVISNVPAYSTPDVTQMTIGLLLEHCMHIGLHSDGVKKGDWVNSADFSYWKTPLIEVTGKTLGIIGMGSIGQSVARVACALGMQVVFVNRSRKPSAETSACRQVELEELLATADFVSLHCPATPKTNNMIDAAAIARMKEGAFLINTARGTLIDEQAVAHALKTGKLSGFAADVVSVEPMSATNPLLAAPHTLITPHIAWATLEARRRLLDTVYANVGAYQNGTPQNVVTNPYQIG